ncbi:MAG: MATE family efflux transporter [Tidjanibacter sp.]|nr:MATE family efflux transporter [Tidjanibacter sp.]
MKTNREILRLAIPNVISNITIPLLGMVDMAVAGRLGSEATIGALAVGTSTFNFIYWNCAFIRMGTSGLTAQAFGARRHQECAGSLVRGVVVALLLALLLLIFRQPIGHLALTLMGGSSEVQAMASEYFFARIWAAPASVSLFALQGWFIGMQDSRTPMYTALLSNVINIATCLWFVFGLGMGIRGIALSTVAAQYGGLIFSLVILALRYREVLRKVDLRESLQREPMRRFFSVNKDIFIRSLCVVSVYTFFTAASSRFGDLTLAANALLMQLFTLYSYMSDGFAYAAESLTGRFVGERNRPALASSIKWLAVWSLGIALLFVAVFFFGWDVIMQLFNSTEAIIAEAKEYIIWVVAVPLLGFLPFLIDGIMLGATRTRVLRNTLLISTAIFYALFYTLVGPMGNNALWLAFVVFIFLRGAILYFATDRLSADKLIE